MLGPEHPMLKNEVWILLNVEHSSGSCTQPFPTCDPAIDPQRNGGLPLHALNTPGEATHADRLTTAQNALDLIGVVPNPYHAFCGYEASRLDSRVKFITFLFAA